MTPAALLSELTSRGMEFQVAGDKLRYRPVELVTADEVAALRRHKLEIVHLLRTRSEQAIENACGKHDDPRQWSYLPDTYHRPGWRTVRCQLCQRFIGHQRPQPEGSDM